jgi:hypothetical protein
MGVLEGFHLSVTGVFEGFGFWPVADRNEVSKWAAPGLKCSSARCGSVCLWRRAGWRATAGLAHPSCPVHPRLARWTHIQGKEGGWRVRALLELQNSTVSGNCPFYPIYNTIGIHPVMKGYWPIIKISSRHWGRLGMQSMQPSFSFFGFWGEGEREIFYYFFSIGGGGLVIHPWNGGTIMWQFIS